MRDSHWRRGGRGRPQAHQQESCRHIPSVMLSVCVQGGQCGRKMSLDVGSHSLVAWQGGGLSQGGLMGWQHCGWNSQWVGDPLKPGIRMRDRPVSVKLLLTTGRVMFCSLTLSLSLHTCLEEVVVQDNLHECPLSLYLEEIAERGDAAAAPCFSSSQQQGSAWTPSGP